MTTRCSQSICFGTHQLIIIMLVDHQETEERTSLSHCYIISFAGFTLYRVQYVHCCSVIGEEFCGIERFYKVECFGWTVRTENRYPAFTDSFRIASVRQAPVCIVWFSLIFTIWGVQDIFPVVPFPTHLRYLFL